MKIVLGFKEARKVMKNYESIVEALQACGEEASVVEGDVIIERLKGKVTSAKVDLTGNVTLEIEEGFIMDVIDLFGEGYIVKVIKNISVIRPFVKFMIDMCTGLKEGAEAIQTKWFADAKKDESKENIRTQPF